MADQELALLFSAPVSIRDLFPRTFGYRLRHAALGPAGAPSATNTAGVGWGGDTGAAV